MGKVRELATNHYDNLPYHRSWPLVLWKFLTMTNMSSYSRVKRVDLKNMATTTICGEKKKKERKNKSNFSKQRNKFIHSIIFHSFLDWDLVEEKEKNTEKARKVHCDISALELFQSLS